MTREVLNCLCAAVRGDADALQRGLSLVADRDPVVQSLDILRTIQDALSLDRIPDGLTLSQVAALTPLIVNASGQRFAGRVDVENMGAPNAEAQYFPRTGFVNVTKVGANVITRAAVNLPGANRDMVLDRVTLRFHRTASATIAVDFRIMIIPDYVASREVMATWHRFTITINSGKPAIANMPTPLFIPRSDNVRIDISTPATDTAILYVFEVYGRHAHPGAPMPGVFGPAGVLAAMNTQAL